MGRLADFDVTLVADEEIPRSVRAHAEEMIRRVARFASRPVLHARASLRVLDDDAVERPAIVKASLDVSGRIVRAHVAAEEILEAVDLLERRLRRNLDDLEELERVGRSETGLAEPGEWRHFDLPTARPAFYPRPAEERELIRRKTFALFALIPEEAASEMRIFDYDFHLFTNADTGEENLVYRREDGTVGLAQITPDLARAPYALVVDPLPAPPMLLEQAIERLDLSGEKFLFFVDTQTRRGNVLYLRYDGHYGLIEPGKE